MAHTLLQRLEQAAATAAPAAASLGGNSVPSGATTTTSSSNSGSSIGDGAAAAAAASMSPGILADSTAWSGAAAGVTSVGDWLENALASPWASRNLSAAGEAVVELAASRFARDALLALPAGDALRAWQEAQAPQRWAVGWVPLMRAG